MSPRIYATLAEAAHAAEAEPDQYEAYANDDHSYQLISAQQAADLGEEEHDRLHYTPDHARHYSPWTYLQDSHTAYTPAQEAAYYAAYTTAYRATYAQTAPLYPSSPTTGFPDEAPNRIADAQADRAGHAAAQAIPPEEEQPK